MLYKYADGFLSFEQFRKVTLPHSVFQTYTQLNLSILIGIIPHDSTLKHYLWRNNVSVSVIWTSPINIKVNCHVLSQQLNCFRLKFCNCCLWIWRISTWLVTSSYAVLMIQATLPLRYYTAHLFHWPSEPLQNKVGMTRNCHNLRQPTVL